MFFSDIAFARDRLFARFGSVTKNARALYKIRRPLMSSGLCGVFCFSPPAPFWGGLGFCRRREGTDTHHGCATDYFVMIVARRVHRKRHLDCFMIYKFRRCTQLGSGLVGWCLRRPRLPSFREVQRAQIRARCAEWRSRLDSSNERSFGACFVWVRASC